MALTPVHQPINPAILTPDMRTFTKVTLAPTAPAPVGYLTQLGNVPDQGTDYLVLPPALPDGRPNPVWLDPPQDPTQHPDWQHLAEFWCAWAQDAEHHARGQWATGRNARPRNVDHWTHWSPTLSTTRPGIGVALTAQFGWPLPAPLHPALRRVFVAYDTTQDPPRITRLDILSPEAYAQLVTGYQASLKLNGSSKSE